MDVFDLLDDVKQRPGMYLGHDDEQRLEQLRNLEMILHGYAIALSRHQIKEKVSDFLQEFGAYLRGRFDWSESCGPIAAVIDATDSPEQAWETFWRLVREFRAFHESGGSVSSGQP